MNLQPQHEAQVWRTAFRSISEAKPFGKYHSDPIAFSHDILGIKTLCDHQLEFLAATVLHDRVVRRSGHGIGKTFDCSVTGLHRLYCRESVVITTAPTWPQVELLLWKEIRKMWGGSKKHLPGRLLKTQITMPDGRYAVGRSTDDPNKFQGFHDHEVVVIEDESPGVHPDIHVAIEGVMSSGGLWVKVGNPTQSAGAFYDCFRDDLWFTMAMSSWEHPNVIKDEVVIPGAVTRKWCEDRLRKWGEDNPLYQSRVMGNFPSEGVDQVISLTDIEAALARPWIDPGQTAPEIWVDVARFGDDESVVGVRHGLNYREEIRYNGNPTTVTAGHCIRVAKEQGKEFDLDPKELVIGVDDDGIGGAVSDILIEEGYNCTMHRGGASAFEDDHYLNRRSESWWNMRTMIKKISIDVDDPEDFTAQLTGTRRKMTRKGLIQMISKDEMKAAGFKSPDRGDTLVMAFAPDSFAAMMAGLS